MASAFANLPRPQLFPTKVDLLLRQIQMIRQFNPLLKITQIGPPIKKPSMGAGRPTFLKLLVGNPSCSPAIWRIEPPPSLGVLDSVPGSSSQLSHCPVAGYYQLKRGAPNSPVKLYINWSLLSNIQLSNIHHFWTSWENPGIASSSWSSHNTDPRRRASGTVSLPLTAQIRWVGSTTTSKMQSAWTSIVYSYCIILIYIYFPWSTRKKKVFVYRLSNIPNQQWQRLSEFILCSSLFSHLETSWNILPGLGRTYEAAATGSPASP